MKRLLIVLAILIAQSIPAVAESREKDLDRWVDRTLIPYVQQQLLMHPRFKNETVMFVVLDDNAPSSSTNALALSMRDRLLAAAVATKGVAIGWQQGRSGATLESTPQDCIHDDVHYYIGIELRQKLDGAYAVNVRALDLEDRNWVTGFGKRWQGRLSTSQRQAMRQKRVDETFLGARDVPFTLAQTDLLAAHLAHQLSCTLKRRVQDDYIVSVDLIEPPAPGLEGTVQLISNNLANRQALTLSSDATATNAILSGKAHPIDGALYQYWVTVTPSGDAEEIAALSASAYIVLPDAPIELIEPVVVAQTNIEPAPRPAPPPVSIPNAGKDALITPLSITAPINSADCGTYRCSLLQTEARVDSVVFFLEHQPNHGLVRLGDAECRSRTSARIARKGTALRFPIARTTTSKRNWSEIEEWTLAPELDTFYVLAVTDASVARRIANHMDKLPPRCGDALRPGLEDDALHTWLTDLAMLTARESENIDWRAIAVQDVL
ncbi:MAG: hypothetical protein QNI98_10710 [Woeseiaceae bacterium]|nr:hypothetical protein [Woeseiaceae bacterium]